MDFETTHTFDQSAKKLARKSLRHLYEDIERLKKAMDVMTFSEIERNYDLELFPGVPNSNYFKGYKLCRFPSFDKKGKNGIRLLICVEFQESISIRITFVDVRDDDDHYDQNLKNKIKATLSEFMEEKIKKDSN